MNALRVFETVGRHLSLTVAADELNLTPGALSRQIKGLEKWLDCPLFIRAHRRIGFTSQGAAYWQVVHRALKTIHAETETITQAAEDRALVVRSPRLFLQTILLPRLPGFYARHENTKLNFVVGRSNQPFDSDIDCAICIGDGLWGDLQATYLARAEMVPICSPGYLKDKPPIRSVADLVHHTLLGSAGYSTYWRGWLGEHTEEVLAGAKIIEFEREGFAIPAAIGGLGIALARRKLVEQEVANGEVVIPLPEVRVLSGDYYLVYPEKIRGKAHFRKFRDWIVAALADGAP